MNAGSVEKVRRLVAGIAYEEAAQLTANLEKCRTAADAENVVYDVVRTKWSHLFETEQEFYRGRRDI
jgi:hypothetical protein